MDGLTDRIVPVTTASAIHSTAVISPGAEIGAGVRIGPFCCIGPDVVIEDGVELRSHVVVEGHTKIGRDSTIYPFVTIGMPPQDLKYRGEPTRCEIGERTLLREHSSVHRGTANGLGVTTIGSDCMLMAVTHVAHDCTLGNHVIIANNAVMGGHVVIGDHAVIGGQAALHQFVRIGRGAMIGGVTGVSSDVIPFGYVFGNRGVLTGLNVIGLKRRGFNHEQIMRMRAAYRRLFLDGGVFADRLAELRETDGSDVLVSEILAFIDGPTRRGLLHARVGATDSDDV